LGIFPFYRRQTWLFYKSGLSSLAKVAGRRGRLPEQSKLHGNLPNHLWFEERKLGWVAQLSDFPKTGTKSAVMQQQKDQDHILVQGGRLIREICPFEKLAPVRAFVLTFGVIFSTLGAKAREVWSIFIPTNR
jgi:hypothetical protein